MRILVALLATLAHASGPRRFNINDGELDSLDIKCVADGAEQIAANGLYLLHWFRTPIDSHGQLVTDAKEKIVEARPDPADENNYNKYPDTYSADVSSGILTVLKGSNPDGTLGVGQLVNGQLVGDQALFECHMTLAEDENAKAVDEQVIIVVVTLPSLDEREPDLIDEQPTQDIDGTPHVYNQDFAGNLVTCQAGHAKPQPDVKWKVESPTGEISFLEASSGLFSVNPLLIDDDETDQFHAAELPLSLISAGSVDLSNYHMSKFTCIVTYQVADENGVLVSQPHEKEFAQVLIKHPVTTATIKVNGKEISNGLVDLTYDETHTISCHPNGYPAAEVDLSAEDISADLQAIKASKSDATVSVSCTARNILNDPDSPVTVTQTLSPSYVSDIKCTLEKGARARDPNTITCVAEGSQEPVVRMYLMEPGDRGFQGSPEDREFMINRLIDPKRKPLCDSNSCETDKTTYYAMATIPETGATMLIMESDGQTVRAQGAAVILEEGVPTWSHTKDNHVNDPAKIKFWHSNAGKDVMPEFTEITGNTEDLGVDYPIIGDAEGNTDANTVQRTIPHPSGGQYVVCYDLGDAGESVSECDETGSFAECAEAIHERQEGYCSFYDLAPTGTAGMMWLWIIIVIILLILIAAIVWWIRQKQAHAETDEEDPELKATQIPGAEDANDEFAIEQETPDEKSPMIKEDEQQQSSRTE